ncbi:MAG TPA: BlaI/MecI/CopY family transcriptional regulator [Nocardioidaceae bacterium]|nr:BlaI/MecI/CopY family transcriptional regulator [Nocardioidaceae bacterium]
MTAARGRPRGGLERDVLACLAAAGRPLSPTEVLSDLGGDLAYTTVMTTLSRLHSKGVLNREAAGRGFAYELPVSLGEVPTSMSAHRMRRILDSGDDRAGILARFVSDLNPEDEEVLLHLLSQDPPTLEH